VINLINQKSPAAITIKHRVPTVRLASRRLYLRPINVYAALVTKPKVPRNTNMNRSFWSNGFVPNLTQKRTANTITGSIGQEKDLPWMLQPARCIDFLSNRWCESMKIGNISFHNRSANEKDTKTIW